MTELDSKTGHLLITEEANVDESIQIYLRKEQSTQTYKETMSIDIDKINTFETRKKVNTIKWRPIYEIINMKLISEVLYFSQMIL